MDNNEHNNEAEALFATKRKQQQAEEAERKRLEEMEQQKRQMAEEVKRLEALQAAQREQEARMAWEAQQAQQAQWAQQTNGGPGTGASPAVGKNGSDPKKKKIILISALAGLAVVLLVVFLILIPGSKSKPTDDPTDGQRNEPSSSQKDERSETTTEGRGENDPELLYFNGHSYKLIDLDVSWMDARAYCIEQGGHLVTITSPEEQDFLANNFYDQKLWIGAFESEEGWCWVTGEAWYYENWRSGEPSGGEEWCGCLWTDMEWNDIRNEDPGERISAFICEYDDLEDVYSLDRDEDLTPFYGTWKYDEYDIRFEINEDGTWSMYDAEYDERDGGTFYWENGWLVLEESVGDQGYNLSLGSDDRLYDDQGYSLSRYDATAASWFEDHDMYVNYHYGDPARTVNSGFFVLGLDSNSYVRMPAVWTVEQTSRQSTGDGSCIITLTATATNDQNNMPTFVYKERYQYGFSWTFCDYYAGLLLPESGPDTLYSYTYEVNGETVHVELSYTYEYSRSKDLSYKLSVIVTVRMPDRWTSSPAGRKFAPVSSVKSTNNTEHIWRSPWITTNTTTRPRLYSPPRESSSRRRKQNGSVWRSWSSKSDRWPRR